MRIGMKKLNVDIENCYGIKKLQAQFDFSQKKAYAIYAPNGAMKSSLAQTFKDVADATGSKDRIFPARVSNRKITDENGVDLPKESVYVIRPYDDEDIGHTEKTSTLLVDSKLRKEYEKLHIEIDKSKEIFLKALKEQSGSKKALEKEISSTFTRSDDEFYRALIRVKDEVLAQKDAPFAGIRYDTIFDEKVLSFLGTKDVKTAIENYVKKHNELLAASTYFKKGTFNYYNAATIAKSLADNGFFDAKHTVNLNADEKLEITSQKQLEELIAKEKEGISNDKDLRKKFADIEKLITKNATVRDFAAYLADHEELLPKLANIEGFKEEIWKSYFKARIELYNDLIEKYQAAEKRKKEIEEEARNQIILTHNFDFFRTINSRFVDYSHCLMALKSSNGISLEQATGIKNVFVNDWKLNFFTDSKKKIASIPFIRNLIEFTKSDKDPDFVKLTSLLHWKSDSVGITQGELDGIYNLVFGATGTSADGKRPVIDIIQHEADECLKACDGINFENKIVLSIAIRLAAEQFMVKKINDTNFVESIDSNQTPRLLAKFKELFGGDVVQIKTIQRVILMTPENIHLNSFMYEPILDMSDEHLRKLYEDVLALGETGQLDSRLC
jgi:hypothetical protein